MKRTSADLWFSLYIRARDKFTCKKCTTPYAPYRFGGDNRHLKGLHNMHMFSRGKWSTRFDEEDCLAGCYGCHSYLDNHPKEKEAFWIEHIGQERFDSLKKRSNKPAIGIKKELKSIAKHYRTKFKALLDTPVQVC